MANVKVSDLVAATALTLADIAEVEQAGVSKKATYDLVRAVLNAPLVSTLAADEVRNNTIALTDTALTVAVEANATYKFEFEGTYTSPSVTPKLQVGYTIPASATGGYWHAATSVAGVTIIAFATATQYGTSAGGEMAMFVRGQLRVAATAGNFRVQVAQGVATVENTVLKLGAQLRLTKLL